MCLGYKAFIFALYFICVSSLFDSSKADSPRVEYIGFPASSVYCPGFLAEAEAMFFYLLAFFWFDSWDFGPLPPRLPEILLSFHSCAHARPPRSAARVPPPPKGSHRHGLRGDLFSRAAELSALLGPQRAPEHPDSENRMAWGHQKGTQGKGCRETLSSSVPAMGTPCCRWDLPAKSSTYADKQ